MRRIGKHLEHINGIRFERAVEDEETSKLELALDFVSVDVVNLLSARLDLIAIASYNLPALAGCS